VRYRAVSGGIEHHRRLADQIVELERLDQIGVPDHRAVGDGEVVEGLPHNLGHPAQPFFEHICAAEDRAWCCIARCIAWRIAPVLLAPLAWRTRSSRESRLRCGGRQRTERYNRCGAG